METKTPKTDKKIANEAGNKHGIVFVANAIRDSLVS
jgi:hypothetical protein